MALVPSPRPLMDELGNMDPEELFKIKSIAELYTIEQLMRSDADKKKRELRSMVGERYRDLIDAADSIVEMKNQSDNIKDLLSSLWQNADQKEIQRVVRGNVKQDIRDKDDDRKQSLYEAAAQIKLLVEVPEQMWRSLENHQYLTASRLFLISRRIYKNLQADTPDSIDNFNVKSTFPVISRQWDAISHFRSQIVQRASTHLAQTGQSSSEIAKTLAAIIILDSITVMDSLTVFLDSRRKYMESRLDKGDAISANEIACLLEEFIDYLEDTIQQIVDVFVRPHSPDSSTNIIEVYISQIQTAFSVQDEATSMLSAGLHSAGSNFNELPRAAVTRLYSSVGNINLLVRYLPDSIQTFTPFLQADGPRGKVDHVTLKTVTSEWLDTILAKVKTQYLDSLLLKIDDLQSLTSVRRRVLVQLSKIPGDHKRQSELIGLNGNGNGNNIYPKQRRKPSRLISPALMKRLPWSTLCMMLFQESRPLWHDLFRDKFNSHVSRLWNVAVSRLEELPDEILAVLVTKIPDAPLEEHDLSIQLWAMDDMVIEISNQNSRSMLSRTLGRKIHHCSPLMREYLDQFEIVCERCAQHANELLETYPTSLVRILGRDLLESEKSDLKKLSSEFDKQLRRVMLIQVEKLQKLLNIARESNPISVQLLIGRIAQATLNSDGLSKLARDKPFSEEPLRELLYSSQTEWFDQIASSVRKGMKNSLERFLDTSNQDTGNELALNPSTTLSNALFNVSMQIHRNGALASDGKTMQGVFTCIVNAVVGEFEDIISNRQVLSPSLQAAFDLLLLEKISLSIKVKNDLIERIRRLQRKLKIREGKEDFENRLSAVLDSHIQRVSTLFGFLTAETVRKVNKEETKSFSSSPIFIPIATQTTRFALLPVNRNCGPDGLTVKMIEE